MSSIPMVYFRCFSRSTLLFSLFVSLSFSVLAQPPFRVMFYNVENYFDCKHDTLKLDTEFMPNSLRAWHYGRFKEKRNHIAQVITAIGGWQAPTLVGLCEVENDYVMKQLVYYAGLKEQGYRYVMTHSSDRRGIDVALLWQRDQFRYLAHDTLYIPLDALHHTPTRDILHVTGLLLTGDSLDVFVCHLPSRRGGAAASEPARLKAASVLKQYVDSLYKKRTTPQIIIMGDFNDYPTNASLVQVLHATTPKSPIHATSLYNLMANKGEQIGTHNYQGEWGVLDQLLVNGGLLQSSSAFSTNDSLAHIAALPFLLTDDLKYGGKTTFRTYYGMRYQGGYSDHLPIWCDFRLTIRDDKESY